MKTSLVAAMSASIMLLAACGDSVEDKVYGPEDYKHFSQTFTMDESTANEMSKDGGSAMVAPASEDPNGKLLTAKSLPGDTTGALLTAAPKNSPGVDLD